eukprot:3251682-Amphidinium_carterae.2
MDLARPFPRLEHLEVLYPDENRWYAMSSVPQLVSVTNVETAELRRQQERVLLFEYARLPNPDRYPERRPGGLPPGVEREASEPGPAALLEWRNQAYNLLVDLCRSPLTEEEVRVAGCVHCNRTYEEVDLYRCVACRTSYVCWDHAWFPACLEGLEILVCANHSRLTPGAGSWNPPGGVQHRGALQATRGRGVARGWEHTALAELSLRPDLESRRRMHPRAQLHLRRLEAAEGISGFNRQWRRFHDQAREIRHQEVEEWNERLEAARRQTGEGM